jgi:uncharacterized protein (TIGR02118 family)
LKTLALIRRRADLTRDAFRAHYEDVHAPLAIATLLDGTRRYVRHHLRAEIFGEPAFDVVTAFWYPDVAAALAVQRRLDGPAGEAIARDEASFMDRAANTFFAVEERTLHGAERRDAGLCAMALVRRPAGQDAGAFAAEHRAHALPRLLDAVRAPAWLQENRALRFGADEPAFDVVTQFHAEADAGLADWARELARSGATAVVAAVSEHESRP